jgi:hypothetical protein
MTGFDFLFALFSLLLGLAIAEVLGGFAQVMKIHARARAGLARDVRVGWLVPLLALFVLLGQLTFWTFTFSIRDQVPFNYVAVLVVTAVVGGYYLLSVLVWPDDFAEWPDFDLYYDQHNRFILTGNLVLAIIAGIISGVYAPTRPPRDMDGALVWFAVAGVWGGLLLNVVLIFVKRRWLNVALLAALITLEVGGSVAGVAAGLNYSDQAQKVASSKTPVGGAE